MLKLHLDTDIGGDIDDLCALAMDYNVQVDVQSAHYVIQRSSPTLVSLSVTVETSLRRAYLATLRRSGPLSELIARQAEAFAKQTCFFSHFNA